MKKTLTVLGLLLVFLPACKKDKDTEVTVTEPPVEQPYVQTTPWHKWIFSHWVWEDEGTTASARQLVSDYLAHDIPVGAIIIDSPWETGYNTFQVDQTLYPGLKAFIDECHSRDVRVMLWITGVINTDVQPLYDEAKSKNYFMKLQPFGNAEVINWWKGDGSLIDWYNPQAVNWWKSKMDSVLALGIDGWKCDGTDYYALQTPYSPGKAGFVSRLDYSHHYYQLFHDYTREKLGIERAITCRPIDNYNLADIGGDAVAFAPKEIGWACWVGDQDATFDGLKAALNNMYHSADYGYLGFGSDIGGYREDNTAPPQMRSKELFVRWAQLGAFSPIMENGGGGEHRPWMFDEEVLTVYRNLVKYRMKILPYLLATAETAYAQGKSMVTFFNKTDYSYQLGTELFVAPVLSAGGNVTVTFPTGSRWVYLHDPSRTYDGGSTASLQIPITEFPVFIREGSEWMNTLKK